MVTLLEDAELLLGAQDNLLEEIAERRAFLFSLLRNKDYNQNLVDAALELLQADYLTAMSGRTDREHNKVLKIYKSLNSDDAKEYFKISVLSK
jgi:hypothetical protein